MLAASRQVYFSISETCSAAVAVYVALRMVAMMVGGGGMTRLHKSDLGGVMLADVPSAEKKAKFTQIGALRKQSRSNLLLLKDN